MILCGLNSKTTAAAMMKKLESNVDKLASLSVLTAKQFSRTFKYLRYQRATGINIPQQSEINYQALLKRLRERSLLPETEKAQYGNEMLSSDETSCFQFWLQEIVPRFTAKHGTQCLSHLQKIGYMMPIADRRRQNHVIINNRTVGNERQEVQYFVFGIDDDHPLPHTMEEEIDIVQILFGKMSAVDKQAFTGMFVSGHVDDESRSIVAYGDTRVVIKINVKKRIKETLFIRKEGAEIREVVCPEKDEIFAAIPDVDFLFHVLGLKFIEYLRFIGGDFQAKILKNRDVKVTAAAFHSLFPSEYFPELKIPLKKIPLNAPYIRLHYADEKRYLSAGVLHQACKDLDVNRCQAVLEKVDVNVRDSNRYTVLQVLLNRFQGIYTKKELEDFFTILSLLLRNGVDINAPLLLKRDLGVMGLFESQTLLGRVLNKKELRILNQFLEGSYHPDCYEIRTLPIINDSVMDDVLSVTQNSLDFFRLLYPTYKLIFSPNSIIHDLYTYIRCNPNDASAIRTFAEVVRECDPNVPLVTYESLTLLMRASIDGRSEVVDVLLQHPDIDINRKVRSFSGVVSKYEGWTALHHAQKNNHSHVVGQLVQLGAVQNEPPCIDITRYDHAAIACVTAKLRDKTYVLLVRKGNILKEPHQHYLFPGGIKDHSDESFQEAAARETEEETNVSLKSVNPTEILAFTERNGTTEVRRGFYHFDLGQVAKLPPCLSRDDIASAEWVAIQDLIPVTVEDNLIYQYNGVFLRFENSLILRAIITQTPLDRKLFSENQQLLYCLELIGEFLVVGIRLITPNNQFSIDLSHLEEIVSKIPEGVVRTLMTQFLECQSESEKRDSAENILLDIICLLTRSARCHVDELRWISLQQDKKIRVFSVFQTACVCSSDKMILELLELGANSNTVSMIEDNRYVTPLTLMIRKKKNHLSTLMIDKYSANVSVRTSLVSPLVWHCFTSEVTLDTINYYLEKMPLVDDAVIGATINACIRTGQVEVVKELHNRFKVSLNRKYSDLRDTESYSQFPLACAIETRKHGIVECVMSLGADPTRYISDELNFRKVVFLEKIKIKKELYDAGDDERKKDQLRQDMTEVHQIKLLIEGLTPQSDFYDRDDVMTYLQKL